MTIEQQARKLAGDSNQVNALLELGIGIKFSNFIQLVKLERKAHKAAENYCNIPNYNYERVEKQIVQQLYHVLSHVQNSKNVSEEFKNKLLKQEYVDIANEFHRVNECGEIKVFNDEG